MCSDQTTLQIKSLSIQYQTLVAELSTLVVGMGLMQTPRLAIQINARIAFRLVHKRKSACLSVGMISTLIGKTTVLVTLERLAAIAAQTHTTAAHASILNAKSVKDLATTRLAPPALPTQVAQLTASVISATVLIQLVRFVNSASRLVRIVMI
jgi:hypothetical protein